MIKKLFIVVLNVLISTLIFADIHLDKPGIDEELTIGSKYQVKWHAPLSEASQIVTVFLGTQDDSLFEIVDDSHTKADGGFVWTVGRLKNGSFVPPGYYNLSLETWDGDTGHMITLKPLKIKIRIPELYRKIDFFPIDPDPPFDKMSYKLDLRDMKTKLRGNREFHVLKLYNNNQFIAKLGQWDQKHQFPDFAKIKLNKNQVAELNKTGKYKAQLHILSLKGKLIHKQDVQLRLRRLQIKSKKLRKQLIKR